MMSNMTAQDVLRKFQKQCDEEGIEIQVSRQALDETLDAFDRLTAENKEMRKTIRWLKSKAFVANTDHYALDKKDTYGWIISFRSSCSTIENALKQALSDAPQDGGSEHCLSKGAPHPPEDYSGN